MDAIETYLNNVFAGFPRTQRVQALKREMLASMEEKYQALKQEGKSEHEAVGSVIANFGSIEEIAAELGIEQHTAIQDDDMPVSRGEALAYLAQTKKCGLWIGFGVWLILTGVALLILINNLSGVIEGNERTNAAGVFILFLTIAAAVVIFIVNGMTMSRYEPYNKNNLRLDTQTRAELEQQSARFTPRLTAQIAAGVAVILLAVGTLALLYQMAGLDNETWPVALLLFVIGFAVLLLITAGMTKSAYDVLLGKGEYKDKVKNKKSERVIGTVASVYWPLTVAVYLLWSFAGDAWQISWMIWPVAGVLFGALSGGISTWLSTKEK